MACPSSPFASHRLITNHAAIQGRPNVRVEILQLGSGSATADAVISGNVDVAVATTPILANLWDKTIGRNTIKGMIGLAASPMYTNTIDPGIASIRDFTPDDRIAMVGGRGSIGALILQMAAAKEFGWDNRTKLDTLPVGMTHPDGVAALLSGGAVVKTHLTTVPFAQIELSHPNVRTILNSHDVLGGRYTFTVAYTTERWRRENPILYSATVAGLIEAMEFIKQNKRAAAELYKKTEPSKLSVDEIVKILGDEDTIAFTPVPMKIGQFTDYMERAGLIKHKVSSWKEIFFDSAHGLPGN